MHRLPLRHIEIRRVVERVPCDQFIHQWKLAAVAAGEDQHSRQHPSIVRDDFSELADTIPSRRDIVERQKPLIGFDSSDRDIRPDPSRLTAVRRQRHVHSHRASQLSGDAFCKLLRGRTRCHKPRDRIMSKHLLDPASHISGHLSDQFRETSDRIEPNIGRCVMTRHNLHMGIEKDGSGSPQNMQNISLRQIGMQTNTDKWSQLCLDRGPFVEHTMLFHQLCKRLFNRADQHFQPLGLC